MSHKPGATDLPYAFRSAEVEQQLCRELAAWSEERKTMAGTVQKHVFVCLSKTVFCDGYYGKAFQKRQHFMEKQCKKAGVKPFGFHSIRHLFASRLWRKNVSLGHIQQLLRHKRPKTTERCLRSIGMERVREALEDLTSADPKILPFGSTGKAPENKKAV